MGFLLLEAVQIVCILDRIDRFREPSPACISLQAGGIDMDSPG